MTEVALVLMPYAALERPSIALGILKAALTADGISSRVLYFNLQFAAEIGADSYAALSATPTRQLVQEWTFAGALHPDFQPDTEAFFRHIGGTLDHLRVFGLPEKDGREGLQRIRQAAGLYLETMARAVLALKPRIVGCSSSFQQHCGALALLRRIREMAATVTTVIGGANCEGAMGLATHRAFPWVDYVVSGEADLLFPELCRTILGGGEMPSRPGLLAPAHRRPGAYPDAGAFSRAQLEDIDRSPAPDYDDYFEALAASPLASSIRPGLLAETSRGCWWGQQKHCAFCGLNGEGMRYRSKSPKKVRAEWKRLSERYGRRGIEVVDNILDRAYLRTLFPTLAGEKRPYELFFETSANIRREDLRLLADAGVRWLQPGIEHLDTGVLRRLRKSTTAARNLEMLKWSREFGIHLLWLFLYNVPGVDDEVYLRQAEWLPCIYHLQPPFALTPIDFTRFSPYYDRPSDHGLKLAPELSYRWIYPLAEEDLARLAFFFDEPDNPRRQVVRRDNLDALPPGARALHKCFAAWRQEWDRYVNAPIGGGILQSLLNVRDDGQKLIVVDTRPCRADSRHVWEGLARDVYRACDRALAPSALLRALSAERGAPVEWEEVQPILAEFRCRRLILEIDGCWLALAVRQPMRPLPHSTDFPGGQVYAGLSRRVRLQTAAAAADFPSLTSL